MYRFSMRGITTNCKEIIKANQMEQVSTTRNQSKISATEMMWIEKNHAAMKCI
jgi:hypothetical protein